MVLDILVAMKRLFVLNIFFLRLIKLVADTIYSIFPDVKGVLNLLMIEVPAVIVNLTNQMLNTDLVKVVVGKLEALVAYLPAVIEAIVDLWAHVIFPAYNDLVILLNKLMKIKFTSMFKQFYE